MDQQDLSGRLARWSMKLQSFNFNIEYRKGSLNVVPDALSRIHLEAIEKPVVVDDGGAGVPPLHVDLDDVAFHEASYVDRVQALRQNSNVNTNYREIDGKLYILPNGNNRAIFDLSLWKLVIPESLVQNLLKQAHNSPASAHHGFDKTLELLKRQFYWASMSRDTLKYIRNCDTCKKTKPPNYITQPEMGSYREVERPFQRLFIDFLGPYPRSTNGNSYLLILLDHYTKFVLLEPVKNATAKEVVSFLKTKVFNIFGVPQYLFSDNGKQFQSNLLADFLKSHGVVQQFTPKYSPQSNASERVNRTIISAIRAYISDNHKHWDMYIHEIGSALRNVTHSSTGFSPYFLTFGQHMVIHGSSYRLMRELNLLNDRYFTTGDNVSRLSTAQELVLSHLRNAYTRNQTNYNLRSKSRQFSPGQQVFARNFVQSSAADNFNAKLAPKFITEKLGTCRTN